MKEADLRQPPDSVLTEMIVKHSIIFPNSVTRMHTATGTLGILPHSAPSAIITAQSIHQAAEDHTPVSLIPAPLPTLPTALHNPTPIHQYLPSQIRLPFSKDYPRISEWLPSLDADPTHNSPTKPQQFSSLLEQFEVENINTIDEIVLLGYSQLHSMLGIQVGDALRLERLVMLCA
jgi:hypothetical protein